MSLSILLFLHLQGSDIHASARFLRASKRVHVCVSRCVSVCLCSRVCANASELGPVGPSAAGPQGGAPRCRSAPRYLVPAHKDHAPVNCQLEAWAATAFGLVLGSVCSREVMACAAGMHRGEGSGLQNSHGQQTRNCPFSRTHHVHPRGPSPTWGVMGSVLESWPEDT